tara:strand:- start:1094 stop:1582 length:489 start_codon:yes stop_codon:yes gene_type:complete
MTDQRHEYLSVLLRYYEEELVGEAYFLGLCNIFERPDQQQKLKLLADVEFHSVRGARSLIAKYELETRHLDTLTEIGGNYARAYEHWSWNELVEYMAKRYPGYLDDFAYLESLAPDEDLPPLEFLTQHEVAAIEFANRELAGDDDSSEPLRRYLCATPPSAS